MSTKSKTGSEFSSFSETWQIGSKYFALVGARFSGKSIRPVFFAVLNQKIYETAFSNPAFFTFKICNPQDAMCCEGNSRKEFQENHK